LAVGAILLGGPRHGDCAAQVRQRVELGLEVGKAGVADAGSGRIAALRHEAIDHAVECDPVVEAAAGKRLDPLDMGRSMVRAQLDGYAATIGQVQDPAVFGGDRRRYRAHHRRGTALHADRLHAGFGSSGWWALPAATATATLRISILRREQSQETCNQQLTTHARTSPPESN
jgi:hypothetical protein